MAFWVVYTLLNVLGCFFVNGVVEVVHHSEIFSPLRRFILKQKRFPFIGRAITCPYCFSFWVGWFYWSVMLVVLDAFGVDIPLRVVAPVIFVGGVVSSRLAQITNDLLYPYLKTIRYDYADYESIVDNDDDKSDRQS